MLTQSFFDHFSANEFFNSHGIYRQHMQFLFLLPKCSDNHLGRKAGWKVLPLAELGANVSFTCKLISEVLATPISGIFVAVDLVQIRKLAETREDENLSFRSFLKTGCNLKPDEVDQRVFEITRRVWAGIDCTTCANCCREMTPTFSEEEVDRVTHRLGMQRQEFIQIYLERSDADSDNPWQTRSTPCPFLKDNLCSIYEDRPADCNGYPYLYKPDFMIRTLAMVERTFTCPIVYEVMEELKKSLHFQRSTKSRRTHQVKDRPR